MILCYRQSHKGKKNVVQTVNSRASLNKCVLQEPTLIFTGCFSRQQSFNKQPPSMPRSPINDRLKRIFQSLQTSCAAAH